MEWIILIAFVAALAGLARHIQTRLPAHVRSSIKRLRSDIEAIDGSIEACRHNLATSTRQSSVDYYDREIAALEARRAEKLQQIQTHKIVARQPKPRRLPAPPLNPRWDKTSPSCYHEEIEPVYTESAGDKPVAYICVKCLDSLDENSPEAKNWTAQQKRKFARAKADAEWRALWTAPENERGEVQREESQLRKMEAIVAARDAGQLSEESARELLNDEPGERVDIHAWGSPEPVRTVDDLPPREPGRRRSPFCATLGCEAKAVDESFCDQHRTKFDKGGFLPPGMTQVGITSDFVRANYLDIQVNYSGFEQALWEKIPGWSDSDTARARQIVHPPMIDADSDWYKPVDDKED